MKGGSLIALAMGSMLALLLASASAGESAAPGSGAKPSGAVRSTACAKIIILESRGTDGPTAVSKPSESFITNFKAEVRARDPSASIAVVPNPYPAWGSMPGFLSALAKLPQAYHKSVSQGKAWLSQKMDEFQRGCRDSKLLLTGYSQGAHVAADVYQTRGTASVLGVVLFGDPKFNGSDPSARGGARVQENGALRPRDKFSVAPGPISTGRVLSYCHARDAVCTGVLAYIATHRSAHTNYHTTTETYHAARYMAQFVPIVRHPPVIVSISSSPGTVGRADAHIQMHWYDPDTCGGLRYESSHQNQWTGVMSKPLVWDIGGRCSNGRGTDHFWPVCYVRGTWTWTYTLIDVTGLRSNTVSTQLSCV